MPESVSVPLPVFTSEPPALDRAAHGGGKIVAASHELVGAEENIPAPSIDLLCRLGVLRSVRKYSNTSDWVTARSTPAQIDQIVQVGGRAIRHHGQNAQSVSVVEDFAQFIGKAPVPSDRRSNAAQPMSPIAASKRCFIMSPSRVSQRAFYCPTRVYFPNKGSAIRSAVNGRNCS